MAIVGLITGGIGFAASIILYILIFLQDLDLIAAIMTSMIIFTMISMMILKTVWMTERYNKTAERSECRSRS